MNYSTLLYKLVTGRYDELIPGEVSCGQDERREDDMMAGTTQETYEEQQLQEWMAMPSLEVQDDDVIAAYTAGRAAKDRGHSRLGAVRYVNATEREAFIEGWFSAR